MNILSDTYIFYADIYVVQNVVVKIAVLYLSLYCNKIRLETEHMQGIKKIVFAAFIGTIIEIVGLLGCNSYTFFLMCVHVFEVPLMVRFVLGKKRNSILQVIVSGYFFLILINGVLEILWNQLGQMGNYFIYLLCSCGAVMVGVPIWKNYHKMQKGIFLVELIHKKNQIVVNGFYDSGNCLKDPYTGRGIHIVSEEIVQKLGLDEEKSVWVPYQSLGNAEGMIEVYYVENFVIEQDAQRKTWPQSPLGVTKDNLFKEKAYDIILNEEVF